MTGDADVDADASRGDVSVTMAEGKGLVYTRLLSAVFTVDGIGSKNVEPSRPVLWRGAATMAKFSSSTGESR
jgi:hypothetical protein